MPEIRGEIFHFINRDAKGNNKYMENYNKNKELPLLKYLDLYNFISQKLPVNNLKRIEDLLNLTETLWNVIMKKVKKDIFSKLIFNIKNIYIILKGFTLFIWKNEN